MAVEKVGEVQAEHHFAQAEDAVGVAAGIGGVERVLQADVRCRVGGERAVAVLRCFRVFGENYVWSSVFICDSGVADNVVQGCF